MAHVPSARMKEVAEDLERIFNASNREDAFAFIEETMDKYEKDIPEVADMLEEGKEDILAVYVLPKKYWKRFRTTNMLERLNEEIRRREKVVRIFPDDGSVMRLIGSLLIERDEEWSSGRVYLDMQEYHEAIPFLEKGQYDEYQGSQKNVPELHVV